MKHLKSTLANLRELLERSLSTKFVMERLHSFDEHRDHASILEFMREKDFDAVGITRRGRAIGFVERKDLEIRGVAKSRLRFAPSDCLRERDPVSSALTLLAKRPRVWVRTRTGVTGIVTRGDLQKAPVRMWLFAGVSLLEMQMLRVIRARHLDGSWVGLVDTNRVRKARRILKDRQLRNEGIDLEDCLEFSDKSRIVTAAPEMVAYFGFPSAQAGLEALGEIERLRNLLAHSQDIVSRDASWLSRIARDIESLLSRCEAWSPSSTA
jgi:hypothetical protein